MSGLDTTDALLQKAVRQEQAKGELLIAIANVLVNVLASQGLATESKLICDKLTELLEASK